VAIGIGVTLRIADAISDFFLQAIVYALTIEFDKSISAVNAVPSIEAIFLIVANIIANAVPNG
jgi:hypothetical protein